MSLLTGSPGRQWHFYECDVLRCGFFYEDSAMTFPPNLAEVVCKDLDRSVIIRLVGRGQTGYDAVCARYGDDFLFPVNLYSIPPVVDPRPSQNMPSWRRAKWHKVLALYRKRMS